MAVAADVEFKMGVNYPEGSVPEIRVTRKKGITAAQATELQERLVRAAQGLLGNEMVFDLAEMARVRRFTIRL